MRGSSELDSLTHSIPMKLKTTIVGALLSVAAISQDVRELSVPTGYGRQHGVTATGIANYLSQGNRLVDIEVESASPLLFTATYVQNTGSYQSGYWWYYGLTSAQVASRLATNQARLIDLEGYDDGNGNARFACVMVPNTGSNFKQGTWLAGASFNQIVTTQSAFGYRPVDLDSYQIGGSTKYLAVMISNTGADYRPFWYLANATQSNVSATLQQTSSRIYCLNRRTNGNYDVVMTTQSMQPRFTWWTNLDTSGVSHTLNNYGHRPVNIEPYFVNGQRRFAMVTIDNSNTLTSDVAALMNQQTDGSVGAYLRRMDDWNGSSWNGGVDLATLNENFVFEPASTMKTLHHVHAMSQVAAFGAGINLLTPLTVFTNYSPTNSSCPVDTGPITESLSSVLGQMMANSDNARTQAVTSFFGQNMINLTADQLGMASTELRHRLGCGVPAMAAPNQITLRDLGKLHEAVDQGFLTVSSCPTNVPGACIDYRDTFYDLMLNSLNGFGVNSVIDQEASQLNLSPGAVSSFKSEMKMAYKGGSYNLNGIMHRSAYSFVEIPSVSGNQINRARFSVGAFVNDATNGPNAWTAVSEAIAEMLRPSIQDALSTWSSAAASAVTVGQSCQTPAQIYEVFPATSFDLLGKDLTFDLSGGIATTVVQPSTGLQFPFGADLGLSDDETSSPIALGFEVEGLGANTIRVCSNGYIWLDGSSAADWSETESEFVSQGARIAAYWTDLNPAAGGSVNVYVSSSLVRVTYAGVFAYNGSAPEATCQVEIRPDSIRISYGNAISAAFATSALVGLSNGNAPSVAPGSVDLSNGASPISWISDLELTAATRPVLGNVMHLDTFDMPGGWIGAVALSMGPAVVPGIGLAPFTPVGCKAYLTSSFVSVGTVLQPPLNRVSLSIPSNTALIGTQFACQSFAVGSAIITSNGVDCVAGAF